MFVSNGTHGFVNPQPQIPFNLKPINATRGCRQGSYIHLPAPVTVSLKPNASARRGLGCRVSRFGSLVFSKASEASKYKSCSQRWRGMSLLTVRFVFFRLVDREFGVLRVFASKASGPHLSEIKRLSKVVS